MRLTIGTQDGALSYAPSDGPVYCVGQATQGSTTAVQNFGDPSLLYSVYGSGKLPDRAARGFGQGVGPWSLLRMASSTAGSLPAYQVTTIHAALAGTAANLFPGPITTPTDPRSVEITFGAGWDGGNVTVVGTGEDDAAITEVIPATAGATVKGLRVFKTFTSFTKGAVGANPATATVKNGNKSTEGGSTDDSNMTTSGTPNEDVAVVIRITRAGSVAGGTAACIVSYDGGDTFGIETAIPAGGVLAGSFGLTHTFVGAVLLVGTEFQYRTIGPVSTNGDLVAALAVLSTVNSDGGELHILGSMTGAMGATLVAWIAAERALARDWQVYVETRDYLAAGETDAAYVAALLADWASVTEPVGALSVIPGWWETVLQGGRGIQRRPFAWAAVDQIWRLPYWVHPSCQQDGGGALRGLYTPTTPGAPNTHDERLSPGLGGSNGRFLTVQSLPGMDNLGQWFIGDANALRSPGTRAAGTSDFSLLMNARVANRTRRACQSFGAKLLANRYATKPNGTLTAGERKKIQGEIRAELVRRLGQAVTDVRVVVSSTEVIRTTKKLPYQVFLNTWAYALHVDGIIGLEPVTA